MAPLMTLLVGSALAWLLGLAGVDALEGWQAALRVGLATMFALTGTAHFTRRRAALTRIVPARLPRPELLVTITGALELAGAVGLLVPLTSRLAAGGLGVLMVVMFPANVRAALSGVLLSPLSRLAPRTVLQILFLAACLAVALSSSDL